MLPKNTLKNLRDFLKKHEVPWLIEDKPKDENKGTEKPSGLVSISDGSRILKHAYCKKPQLEDFLRNKQQFMRFLKNAIGEHKNSEIYKKAIVSKQVFSKLCHHKLPAKDTVIMLAFALKATIQEAEELLKHSGHFLGDCVRRDMIFRYCFENRIFDVLEVNDILVREKESPLWKDKKKKK